MTRIVVKEDYALEPWNHNPSSWRQRIPICLLGGVGAILATYLALYQLRLINHAWDPIFGDGTIRVLDSDVSEYMKSWLRIPDAALGTIAYLGDAIFCLAGSSRRWQYHPWLVLVFGFDVIPLGVVSIILVALQGMMIGSWCFFCIVTAIISLILIFVSYDEIWSCLLYLVRIYQRSNHNKRILWQAFWGTPNLIANSVAQEMIKEKNVAASH